MFRHEGKLTGLAARGEPLLADDIASHFWVDNDGMISASFADDRAIERMIAKLCNGHARETIAASIQKVVEDLTLRSIQHWLLRTQTRHLGLAGGLFANVRLNRLLAEKCPIDEIFIYPAMSDGGLSVGAGLSFLLARDGFDPQFGARPLKRVIQETLLDPLSIKLLEGEFKPGDSIGVAARQDALEFRKKS